MAINDTPWCGSGDIKLFLQSGQFTSTIKTSEDVSGIDTGVNGISWDGTNTPWCGATDDKLYLQSGQFTSTIKTSESITATEAIVSGISWDATNTPWTGSVSDKLYLQSGQFTSTIKTSENIVGVDNSPQGISFDATNTPWCGVEGGKLYLTSGQFTSTIKTSESISGIDVVPSGISYNGTDTPWIGDNDNKLYLTSGQFSSTLKDSEAIGVTEATPSGICTNNVSARLSLATDITVTPSELTLTSALPVPDITGADTIVLVSTLSLSASNPAVAIISDCTVTPSVLIIGLLQEGITILAGADVYISLLPLSLSVAVAGIPVISGDAFLLLPDTSMPSQGLGLSLNAPTVNITDDIRILVTNTRNFAITEYSNFAFNSMCKFNGKFLYAKSDGIYEGGGDTDNGTQIVASYKTGAIDTYTTEVQRLRDAYLTFRSDGDVQLFSVGDEINTRAYTITGSPATTIHERRVKFERGIKDRHFNLGISNVNGSTLEADSIKVLTEPIRKRR